MVLVGKIIAGSCLIVVTVFLWGLVLCDLWEWFVMPLFDVPPLTVLGAVGLGMVGWAFTGGRSDNNSDRSFWERGLAVIVEVLAVWMIAGIYHVIMTGGA